MALLLDAGAFVAYERGDLTVETIIEEAGERRVPSRTTTAVVAQVWRNGARQARLARLLKGVDELGLDSDASRRIGHLIGKAKCSDVVDGSIVDIACSGDRILTSDPGDIQALVEVSGKQVLVTPV